MNTYREKKQVAAPLALEINNLELAYQQKTILKELNLEIQTGQIGCLIGYSAGGKTSLLKAIAGLLPIKNGFIKLKNFLLSSNKIHISTEKRNIGLFFQDYSLFTHLNVLQNIEFGLFHWPKNKKKSRLDFLINLFSLEDIATSYPAQISGGQQQRVALARSMAPAPEILLLDEPFSNLDPELREHLIIEVRSILKATNTTTLMVTHDQKEAFLIGDKIGVLLNGKIVQWGCAKDLYSNPKNRLIASFVGEGFILPGKLLGENLVSTELGKINVKNPLINCPVSTVEVLIRPEDVTIDENSPLKANLISKSFRGHCFIYNISLPSGLRGKIMVPSFFEHPIGCNIGIKLKNNILSVFPLLPIKTDPI